MKEVEGKASALFTTVVVLVPLCLGALSLMWQVVASSAARPSIMFVVLCVLSLLSLLGAALAVFRVRSVAGYHAPGLEAIINTKEGSRRTYDAERDAYGLIWCATMNHALASLRVDFLRAGQTLVSAALFFLALSSLPLASASWEKARAEPTRVDLENRIEQLEQRLGSVESLLLEKDAAADDPQPKSEESELAEESQQ